MSDNKKTVRVFNTFTGMYEDVEVSEKVLLELKRDRWRNEKREAAINEREMWYLLFYKKGGTKHGKTTTYKR